MIPLAADLNELALGIFALIVAITLGITYWASKRTRSATEFWAAGRGITGVQNGFAIAGDYMSAASFLGIAGLIFLFGFDGVLYAVGFLVAFLTVLFLLAERMRNAGRYTIADVLVVPPEPAPGAGGRGARDARRRRLLPHRADGRRGRAHPGARRDRVLARGRRDRRVHALLRRLRRHDRHDLGADHQGGIAARRDRPADGPRAQPRRLEPARPVRQGRGEVRGRQGLSSSRGSFLPKPIDTVSLGLALVLGTAGLPHILMRFFTVPDAKAARSSVVWAIFLIGAFYLMVTALGLGARVVLGTAGEEAAGKGGNLAAPLLAEALGGGAGTVGGDVLLAFIAAVAFATILAVVAGLVISASGAVAHDVWSNVVRHDRDSEHEEILVARIAALGVGAVAIAIAIIGGSGLNVSFMVGLAFAVAASANFPALLLALTWRRFNTTGAVTGVLVGVVSSIALVIMSPGVWPGPDSEGSPFPLANPGIVSIPLGFLGCFLGTMLSREHRAHRTFQELSVRSETGIGAERALTH